MILSKQEITDIRQNAILSEGLIMTHNISSSTSIIKSNKYTDKFIINKKKNIFKIVIIKEININKLLTLLNNLGWFISYIEVVDKYKGIYNKNIFIKQNTNKNTLILTLEAKFDVMVDKNQIKELYHISIAINHNKIMKQGIKPKSKNKIGKHPNRAYLLTDKNQIKSLLMRFKKITKHNEFVIYKISNDVMDDVNFFSDPNYLNSSIYTLNTINSVFIEGHQIISI